MGRWTKAITPPKTNMEPEDFLSDSETEVPPKLLKSEGLRAFFETSNV